MPFIYFFSNYNSIKVYKIGGESEHFNSLNGLMIVTKKNFYIRFGMVNAFNENDKVTEARLYYKNGDEEINLRTRENLEDLIVNKYGYDEYFSYRDVDKFMDNLYLEVNSDKYDETIKLKFRKVESNDNFVYTLNNNVSDDESSNVIDYDIPKYVRDNFKYDSDMKVYVYEHKDGDTSIVEKYSSDTNIYDVVENYGDSYSKYNLSLENNDLTFKRISDNRVNVSFDYNLNELICKSEHCDAIYVERFKDNYWKNLEIN